MQTMYKCCKCGELYEWYESVYEQENGDKRDPANISIRTNGLQLVFFEPVPEKNKETLDVKEAEGNLAGTIINFCPKCMREFLSNIHPQQEGNNCFDEV